LVVIVAAATTVDPWAATTKWVVTSQL